MNDTATGKSYIVTKIFDDNCDVCKHMERHDRATFENFGELSYQKVSLDDIVNHQNNLTKLRIYQILERRCLSPTYEIDLPVYVLMSSKGSYLGHLQGALTVQEIREGVKEIMDKHTDEP